MAKSDEQFLTDYFNLYIQLMAPSKSIVRKLVEFSQSLRDMQKRGSKAIIVGNGGSAAIASHFSVDLTKNAGIRCINFNEADLITCFSNDFGYESWVENAVKLYGDKGDIFVAISSSGRSENIINGCKAAEAKSFSKVITFSGFDSDNPLKKCGDINFWIDSRAYNFVENLHQFWLLAAVDLIIGKIEYSSN